VVYSLEDALEAMNGLTMDESDEDEEDEEEDN